MSLYDEYKKYKEGRNNPSLSSNNSIYEKYLAYKNGTTTAPEPVAEPEKRDFKADYLANVDDSGTTSNYADILKSANYADMSQYKGDTTKDYSGIKGRWESITDIFRPAQDKQYEAINGVSNDYGNGLFDAFSKAMDALGKQVGADDVPYLSMTETEKGIYNYLYNTGDTEGAAKYYKEIEPALLERAKNMQAQEEYEKASEGGYGRVLGTSIANLPKSVLNGVNSAIVGTMAGISSEIAGDGFQEGWTDFANRNVLGSQARAELAANAAKIAEDTSTFGQDVEGKSKIRTGIEKGLNALFDTENLPSALYNSGMSAAENLVGLALTKGLTSTAGTLGISANTAKKIGEAIYLTSMGGNAAEQKTLDILQRGGTEEEAALSGITSGLIEAATEHLGFDTAFDIITGKSITSAGAVAKSLASMFGSEALEESTSDVLNRIADYFVLDKNGKGAKSEWQEYYEARLAEGNDAKTAENLTLQAFWRNATADALFGGLSGIALGGASVGANVIENRSTGKAINRAQNVDKLREQAIEAGRNDLAGTLDKASKTQVGFVQNELLKDAYDRATKEGATAEDAINYVKALQAAEGNKLSKTGIADKKGNPLHIKNINWDGDNPVFETEEGFFKAPDVVVSDSAAGLINLSENIDKAARKAFIENYKGGNLGDYTEAFNLAYEYGKQGWTGKIADLAEEGILSFEQAKNIWAAGLMDKDSRTNKYNAAQEQIEQAKKLYPNKKIRARINTDSIDLNKLDNNQRRGLAMAEVAVRALNVNVTLVDDKNSDIDLTGRNGAYDPATNTIYLNINAENTGTHGGKENAMVTALSHEVTHWAEHNAPGIYKVFRGEVVNELAAQYGKTVGENVDIATLIQLEKDRVPAYKNLTTAEIESELVARACENMLSNSEYFKEVVSKMTAEEQKTFIAKIKEWFEKIIDAIKEVMGRYDSKSAMYQLLSKDAETYQEFMEEWDEMVKAAAGNVAYTAEESTNEGEKALSVKDSEGNILTAAQVEFFKNSELRDENGNLKVMYHGTNNAGFTVFERSDDDLSYFFTDSKEVASTYSGVPYIENPDKPMTFEELAKTYEYFDYELEKTEDGFESEGNTFKTLKEAQNWIVDNEIRPAAAQNMKNPSNYKVYLNIKNALEIDCREHDWDALPLEYGIKDWEESGFESFDGEITTREYATYAYDHGYDGVIFHNIVDSGNGEDMTSTVAVVFKPEQIKSVYNENPTSNSDIRFSMKSPVEPVGDLVAIHNMHAAELLDTLKLGGFPMPSIAIMKADDAGQNSQYGEVSIVFTKDTIDPKRNRANKVYGSDAWTPTFPQISYKISEKEQKRIDNKIRGLIGDELYRTLGPALDYENMTDKINRSDSPAKAYDRDTAVKAAYLAEIGKAIDPVTKTKSYDVSSEGLTTENIKELLDTLTKQGINVADYNGYDFFKKHSDLSETIRKAVNDNYQEKYAKYFEKRKEHGLDVKDELYSKDDWGFSYADRIMRKVSQMQYDIEHGGIPTVIDKYATEERINELVPTDDKNYQKWLDETFKDIIEKRGLRNDKDMFTNSGNRRSWDALHLEVTLENIVKAMKSKGTQGIGMMGFGSPYGAAAKEFSSIDDIRAHKPQLKPIPQDEYNAIKDEYTKRFGEIANRYSKRNDFGAVTDAGSALIEAIANSKSKAALKAQMQKDAQWFNYSDDLVNDLWDLVTDIQAMPTGYFEAKPQRAVRLDEIYRAVVPDNVSQELKDLLTENNVPVDYYEAGNDEARLADLNELTDVRFSDKVDDDAILNSWKDDEGNLHLDFDTEEFEQYAKVERDVKRLSKEWRDKYGVQESAAEISRMLKAVIESDKAGYEKAVDELTRTLVKNARSVEPGIKAEADRIKKELKKYKFSMNDKQKAEMKSAYGANWSQKIFGKLSYRKDGIPLDDLWSTLVSEYPTFFHEETDANEPIALIEAIDELYSGKYAGVEWGSEDKKEIAKEIKADVKEVYDVARSLYDDAQAPVDMETLEKKYGEAIRELHQRIAAAKREVREDAQRQRLIAKIVERENKLATMFRKNDKENHIPDILKEPLKQIFESVNIESRVSPGTMANNFTALAKALEDVTTQPEALEGLEMYFDSEGYFIQNVRDIAAELQAKIGDIANNARKGVSINDLSAESLKKLNEALAAITAAARKYDRVLAEDTNQRISDRAESSMQFVGSIAPRKATNKLVKQVVTFLGWDNVTPVYGYDRFGEGGKQTFKGIMAGDDQLTRNSKTIIDFAKNTFTGQEAEDWNNEIQSVTVAGKEYFMTTAQIMSLYCLNKRESAKQHLYLHENVYGEEVQGEGIIIGENKETEKTGVIHVTENDIKAITDLLTDRQKEVADKLQEFLSTVCSDWGNYVTMRRFGIMQFGEKNYFPMNVNPNNRASLPQETMQQASIFKLLNMGFTKSLNERGNGALIISSIFDVFTKHASEMAAYNAMALPILDAYKWLSYKVRNGRDVVSFKNEIERAYGSDGLNFILDHLADLNGTSKRATSAEQFVKSVIRRYKTAATAANLRVVLMQPTSYLRALNEIDGKYLRRAITLNPKELKATIAEMNEKSALAMKKNGLGAFDLNVSRTIEEQAMQSENVKGVKGAIQKAMDASMWLAGKADEITWGTLYKAVQLEISEKTDLKGEAFDKAVNDRFEDICYRTQVFDDINARSNLMRKKDIAHQVLTAFGSEPTLSYSMLSNNVFMYAVEARNNRAAAWHKYAPKIKRAFVSYLMSAIAVSAVAAVPDWLRDDDDEEGFLQKYFKNLGMNILGEATGLLPYIRDIASIFQGYDPSRPDEEIIKTARQFVNHVLKSDGNISYRTVYSAAKLFSQATGVPVANVVRDIKSLWNKTIGEIFGMKIE